MPIVYHASEIFYGHITSDDWHPGQNSLSCLLTKTIYWVCDTWCFTQSDNKLRTLYTSLPSFMLGSDISSERASSLEPDDTERTWFWWRVN